MRKKIKFLIVGIILWFCVMVKIVYASEASLSVSSATVGKSFTVTINMPSDVVAYQGTITVTYANGKTESVKIASANLELQSVGNVSESFTAPVEGAATVKVTGLTLSNASSQKVNTNNTISKSFTVNADKKEPAPSTDDSQDVPLSGGETGNSNKVTSKDNVNKTTNTQKENKVAENKVENTAKENTTEENTQAENTITNTEAYQNLVNEIGVLPEVGKNAFDTIAIIYMIGAIGIVVGIIKADKKEKKKE